MYYTTLFQKKQEVFEKKYELFSKICSTIAPTAFF